MQKTADGTLVLEGTWSIHYVDKLKTKLEELLRGDFPSAVDLSGVEWIDTAGMQLLLALLRKAKAGVVLRGMNPDVLRCLEVTGIDRVIAAWGHKLERD